MKKPHITPFSLLILFFLSLLVLGILILFFSQQPPRITHSLPRNV